MIEGLEKKYNNPYFIYNPAQANWLLKQGCMPEEIGKGLKGDMYLKFPRTYEIEKKVSEWKLRKI